MDKYSQRCVLIFAVVIFLFAVPYFLYTYAQEASESATGCFILNQDNLPSGTPLPAGCDNGGGATSVVALARKHLAGSYIWAAPQPRVWADWNPNTGHAPTHFDCSGFAGWVW